MKAHIDTSELRPFPLYSANVDSWNELEALEFPSPHFVLFIAADFQEITNDPIFAIAYELINKGLLYICLWGPGADMAHNTFDWANVAWDIDHNQEHYIMSTGHEDESLEEALWECLFLAFPEEDYWDSCSTVVVHVGNIVDDTEISAILDDLDGLNRRVAG